jgi:hypothetical protein
MGWLCRAPVVKRQKLQLGYPPSSCLCLQFFQFKLIWGTGVDHFSLCPYGGSQKDAINIRKWKALLSTVLTWDANG